MTPEEVHDELMDWKLETLATNASAINAMEAVQRSVQFLHEELNRVIEKVEKLS